MIRFVTALTAEATPIVERFRMTRREGSFPIYSSDNASLVVSGMGKRASAAATAYLHAKTEEKPNPVWVNVGIGGPPDVHARKALGRAYDSRRSDR